MVTLLWRAPSTAATDVEQIGQNHNDMANTGEVRQFQSDQFVEPEDYHRPSGVVLRGDFHSPSRPPLDESESHPRVEFQMSGIAAPSWISQWTNPHSQDVAGRRYNPGNDRVVLTNLADFTSCVNLSAWQTCVADELKADTRSLEPCEHSQMTVEATAFSDLTDDASQYITEEQLLLNDQTLIEWNSGESSMRRTPSVQEIACRMATARQSEPINMCSISLHGAAPPLLSNLELSDDESSKCGKGSKTTGRKTRQTLQSSTGRKQRYLKEEGTRYLDVSPICISPSSGYRPHNDSRSLEDEEYGQSSNDRSGLSSLSSSSSSLPLGQPTDVLMHDGRLPIESNPETSSRQGMLNDWFGSGSPKHVNMHGDSTRINTTNARSPSAALLQKHQFGTTEGQVGTTPRDSADSSRRHPVSRMDEENSPQQVIWRYSPPPPKEFSSWRRVHLLIFLVIFSIFTGLLSTVYVLVRHSELNARLEQLESRFTHRRVV